MKLNYWRFDLQLAHRWTIASALKSDGSGGLNIFKVAFVELTDKDGIVGIGEAAPSSRYHETVEGAMEFLGRIDPTRLSFADLPCSMAYLEQLGRGNLAAKGAVNLALWDGAARHAGKPVYDLLGLGFSEGKHITSFSIGIDEPQKIREKVRQAHAYPVLKLKVGSPNDRQNLAALREVAPDKPVRVDANEAWKTKEDALKNLEWLARDGHIQFVEQPMPANSPIEDLAWLKARTPLTLMADESCHFARDVERCAAWAHAVNVKLVKTGGLSAAFETLQAARKAGLKTMIGCMIESSLLITAGAHLAELADELDLDGNLLITNDPSRGVTTTKGVMSFKGAPLPHGLRVEVGKCPRT